MNEYIVKTKDSIVQRNIELLDKRSIVGVAKYNTTLDKANLTRKQLLQHALEEALDMANYLQALIDLEE